MRVKRSVMVAVAAMLITAMLAPVETYAAPKVLKTRTYNGVIKSGYTCYVAGTEGLYKVWLNKNGSKKRSKLIYRQSYEAMNAGGSITEMKKHGQYIYMYVGGGTLQNLIRINTKTGKRKWLSKTTEARGYAIYKNKIYYVYTSWKGGFHTTNAVMNLDGTNARRTTIRPSMTSWQSTTKGYYVRTIRKGRVSSTYLKTPRGLYKLGSHTVRKVQRGW